MTKDVKKEKELKGFDQIYSRIPHLSVYQICILVFSSYTIILSGKFIIKKLDTAEIK